MSPNNVICCDRIPEQTDHGARIIPLDKAIEWSKKEGDIHRSFLPVVNPLVHLGTPENT